MTLDEEKRKVYYDHKLQLWRIVTDKVLLGLVIAGIGYIGNLYLESYKSGLTQERFLLETRLEALKKIRKSYSMLSRQAEILMNNNHSGKVRLDLKEYKSALTSFIDSTNEWSMLFSSKFDNHTKYHMWLHGAVANGAVRPTIEHWPFFKDLFEQFDEVTSKALWEETLGVTATEAAIELDLEEWNEDTMKERGSKEYFEANFEKWKGELKS